MRFPWPTAVLFVVLAGPPVVAQGANVVSFPMKNGMVEFVMPSKNMECTFVPKQTAVYMPIGGGPELTCDRRDPTYVRVVLGPTKAAERTDNPGEQPCCGAENILEYGRTWVGGPFTCKSAASGLTCRHTNGHGFFMSQKRIEVH
jgi:hypothetical protein